MGLVYRWCPAAVVMLTIFVLSAQTGYDLPNFGSWDYTVKKAGHFLGYGLLGLAYWRGFKLEPKRTRLAWLLAVLYAATDEFHQSFVAGRHPSALDVLLFDGGGAAAALWLSQSLRSR